MNPESNWTRLPKLCLGLLVLAMAPRAEAQTTPTVAQVPSNAPPAVPSGMKVTCTPGPATGAMSPSCPVLQWNGYTYWAYSYGDNRNSLGIVAYDSAGKVAAQWEKTGVRYVYAISVDSTAKTVTFAGQADKKVSLSWAELTPPPAAKPFAYCGREVQLKSWKGDYLSRTSQPQGASTSATDASTKWKVECKGDKVLLKSAKGDYLHRPDAAPSVTTWGTGVGNEWTPEYKGDKLMLKSWKGDYLHRPDAAPSVTSWGTGVGNEWSLEPVLCGSNIQLKSWKGDYLSRTSQPQGATTSAADASTRWSVECKGDKVLLKSAKGDYLHRPDAAPSVTTWGTGVGNEWAPEYKGDKLMLKSWKGDYLHRPDAAPSVTSWGTGVGNEWNVEFLP